MNTTHNNDLLTVEQLSEYLHVPVDTLYAWKYKGYGPTPRKVGRHLRYRRHDVEEWLEDRGVDSTRSTFKPEDGAR